MNNKTFKDTVFIHRNKMFCFALSLLKNRQDAEDVIQELLYQFYKKKDVLNTYENLEAVLMSSVKNKCFDFFKKRKRDVVFEDGNIFEDSLVAQNLFDAQNKLETVKNLIAKLPYKQQMCLHLREVEGYEFYEIAQVLEINEGAVRTNLSRARKQIKQWFKSL